MPPGGPGICHSLPQWFYSSEAWLRWGWNVLEWLFVGFSLMLEPSVAVEAKVLLNMLTQAEHSTGRKEAAILSGPIKTSPGFINVKQLCDHSCAISLLLLFCFAFWFFCPVVGYWGRGQGCLFMLFIYFWFSLMACLHAHSQVPIFLQKSERRVRVTGE